MNDSGAVTVLALLALVGLAYLLAHFVVEWIQRRFLVVSGLEYILLGVGIGPTVSPDLSAIVDLTVLAPVIAFAAGWIGLLYGMELDFRTMMTVPDRSVRLAVGEGAVTGLAVGLTCQAVLGAGWPLPHLNERDAAIAGWALGCAAAAGSSGAVDLVRSRYVGLETELLPLLRRSARLGDLLAIAGFGALFCVYHEGAVNLAKDPAFSDWILITMGLGLGLGVLFAAFLGDTTDDNHRFLALTGIVIFASGAAFFLNLGALAVNVLLGVVVVNWSRHGKGIYEVLERTQAPVRLVLLVFAGALWKPVALGPGLAMALGYIALRVAVKVVAGFLATVGTPLRSDLFRGLMAQGDVAIAIAIGFRLVYSGPAIDLAYTAILGSVVVNELVAPRLLRGLLIDAGELRQDVDPSAPTGAT